MASPAESAPPNRSSAEHGDGSVRLQFIGGGRMGEALVAGLINSGTESAEAIAVVEALPARRDELGRTYPGLRVREVPCGAATVVAVKPHDVADAVSGAVAAGATRVLSVAAGVTLSSLEAAAETGVAVVRAMPNTPALVGEGATAFAPGSVWCHLGRARALRQLGQDAEAEVAFDEALDNTDDEAFEALIESERRAS